MATAKPAYKPRLDSIPGRVVSWFRENPEEELTSADIIEKFETGQQHIHTVLGPAVEAGLLARHKNEDLELVYHLAGKSKGRPALQAVANAPSSSSPFGAPKRSRQNPAATKAALSSIDLAALPIEDNVPLPPGRHNGGIDWTPLLKRLKVNQSAAVPYLARFTLRNALNTAHKSDKARYALRIDKQAEQLRVWRIA